MAAASRKEEERNERIVRGLLKLPPNRRCINCNGIVRAPTLIRSCDPRREFTHRVKSVSMSKFTVQEVEALQKGGNQRARESLLKDFDTQQMRLPDSSNINSLREFIRVVYVERRYAGSRTLTVINVSMIAAVYIDASEFLFRFKNHTKKNIEGLVPIIHFLEERRNGKQPAILTRKPGSDRGHDGKMSYRSNSLQERMSEDQFANETRESRTSDCSGSSDDDCHKVFMEELAPSAPFAAFLEPSPISAAPSLGRTSADKAVLNPFDLPFDTDSEAPGLFMDVSTLQAALPNLPSSFLDGLPESWFSNNTSTYVPSGSHGGLSCLAEQAPNSPLR
ncbi:hypothetical protein ACQ4PT_048588 [Festuca glaucescens]